MKDTVCVTGGSGGIGQALLEQLVELYEVRCLFRAKSAVTEKWEQRGCTAVWGDLGDDDALAELVKGARFVFHCAALVASGSYKKAYPVNVQGTRRLAQAAAAQGCQRLIHTSSIAVYSGASGDEDYYEATELRESDDMAVYSRTKVQAEQALQEVGQERGLEYTILRPTCVYGPHTKSYTLVPIELIRKGLPLILGDGRAILDAVYVDDVATALLLAAHSPRASGKVFNIGHEAVTFNDFYSYYGKMLNRPVRHVPRSLVSSLARLLRLVPDSPDRNSREIQSGVNFLIRTSENTKHFPSAKAVKLLGYAPRFPLPIGMLKTELWAKSRRLAPVAPYSLPSYGPLPFRPLALVHPQNEEELAQTVQAAVQQTVKVKAIGSLHSLSPVPETEGVCMVLDKYNKLVSIDNCMATVQAGMTLRDLNDALSANGLALPTIGSITDQTVSGAISTATHGGSIYHGSISDYVETVRIVRADGSILDISRSDDVFEAVAVSMGLLGVISTVTFRCTARFLLRSRSCVKSAGEVLEKFNELHRGSLYMDMLYFAVTDQIEILSIDKIEEMKGEGPLRMEREAATAVANGVIAKARHKVAIGSLKGIAWVLRRSIAAQRSLTKLSVGSSYRPCMGRSDLILGFGDIGKSARTPRILGDMEVAVPYEQASTALGVLRDHFLKTRNFPLLPIHIRCSARSDLWLSPAYKRDVCWLEFWQYPRTSGLFKQIHELLEPFHYRFHWGKEAAAGREYIQRQYEKWDDFVQLRAEWDPKGAFLNPYLESLLSKTGRTDSERS